MAWEALSLLFLVSLLYLAIGAWVLYLDPRDSIHRSFAMVLLLRALGGAVALAAIIDHSPVWPGYRGYFLIALPFAILDFFIVYSWRQPTRGRRAVRSALLVGVFVAELVYLTDHGRLWHPMGEAPLGVFTRLTPLLAALLGVWFAVAARKSRLAIQARFHRLLSLAWTSFALVDATLYWSSAPTSGVVRLLAPSDQLLYNAYALVSALQLPVALVATSILAFDPRLKGAARAWTLVLLGSSILIAFGAGMALDDVGGPLNAGDAGFLFLLGAARLVAPAVLAYAILKQSSSTHAVFDLDYRVHIAFRRSSVGGVLLAGYFVVSQLAGDIFENVDAFQAVGPVWAQVLGMGSAALLLLALHPIGRVADRMAQSALPRTQPMGRLNKDERLAVYEEQVEIAWADGSLSRKERLLLDRLRDRLHVPLPDAAAIERRVLKVAT